MKIGNVNISGRVLLAPMAGVADSPFRIICRSYGAAYTVSEMISAKGIYYHDLKSETLMRLHAEERPSGIQLFGCEPEVLAYAAQIAMKYQPEIIDINMGCPVPKIVNNGGGSALMKSPALAGKIIRAVVDAVPVPVTVKIRSGWDNFSKNAVSLAKTAEANGAAAITVHGRTREQMYAPPVDFESIRQVKQAVSIPVAGNGGIASPQDAIRMFEETGCDLIMVGRGALGAPWIFSHINHFLKTGETLPLPDVAERMQIMLTHIRLMIAQKGESFGIREARKHAGWYMRNLRGAASFRKDAGMLSSYADAEALAEKAARYAKPEV